MRFGLPFPTYVPDRARQLVGERNRIARCSPRGIRWHKTLLQGFWQWSRALWTYAAQPRRPLVVWYSRLFSPCLRLGVGLHARLLFGSRLRFDFSLLARPLLRQFLLDALERVDELPNVEGPPRVAEFDRVAHCELL